MSLIGDVVHVAVGIAVPPLGVYEALNDGKLPFEGDDSQPAAPQPPAADGGGNAAPDPSPTPTPATQPAPGDSPVAYPIANSDQPAGDATDACPVTDTAASPDSSGDDGGVFGFIGGVVNTAVHVAVGVTNPVMGAWELTHGGKLPFEGADDPAPAPAPTSTDPQTGAGDDVGDDADPPAASNGGSGGGGGILGFLGDVVNTAGHVAIGVTNPVLGMWELTHGGKLPFEHDDSAPTDAGDGGDVGGGGPTGDDSTSGDQDPGHDDGGGLFGFLGGVLNTAAHVAIGVTNPVLGLWELTHDGRLPFEPAPGKEVGTVTKPDPVEKPSPVHTLEHHDAEYVARYYAGDNVVDTWRAAGTDDLRLSAARRIVHDLDAADQQLAAQQAQVETELQTHTGTNGMPIGEGGSLAADDTRGWELLYQQLDIQEQREDIAHAQDTFRKTINAGGSGDTDPASVAALGAFYVGWFDADRDGSVNVAGEADRFGLYSSAGGTTTWSMAKLAAAADADSDGIATADEVRTAIARYDADGDGSLTGQELRAFVDAVGPTQTHTPGLGLRWEDRPAVTIDPFVPKNVTVPDAAPVTTTGTGGGAGDPGVTGGGPTQPDPDPGQVPWQGTTQWPAPGGGGADGDSSIVGAENGDGMSGCCDDMQSPVQMPM